MFHFVKIHCYSIFWGVTPPPNNHPYSSGKGIVKIVQIWQPEIVQSSNQIISRNRHDSDDLSVHKIPNFFHYIKVRGLGWPLNDGHVLVLQPCDSSTRRVGRSIATLKQEWMISVARYVFYRTKKVFWLCSDINVRIHIFIENEQIANTVVANSGIYFSPAVFHTPTLPSQCAKLNLDSLEKASRTSCLVLSR